MRKYGQAWGFDLVVASIIFTFAILSFYIFAFNYSTGGEENFNSLMYEGELIAESLLSEGNPAGWNESNAVRIGILSGNKINNTKLEIFYNMTINDYEKTKNLFNVKDDYYIEFSKEVYINGADINPIGNVNQNPENLIRISRFSIYNDNTITININIWS